MLCCVENSGVAMILFGKTCRFVVAFFRSALVLLLVTCFVINSFAGLVLLFVVV
jgi:hypothetical protein